jgi:hypothetical protein
MFILLFGKYSNLYFTPIRLFSIYDYRHIAKTAFNFGECKLKLSLEFNNTKPSEWSILKGLVGVNILIFFYITY